MNVPTTVVTLANNISKVKHSLRAETLRRAAEAGGTVIQNYARINVNATFSSKSRQAEGLGGSIQVVVTKTDANSAEVEVGPTKIYGRIQELGGIVKPVFAELLSWVNEQGQRIFAKAVVLPPRPYLGPAADDHHPEILDAVGEQIRVGIEGSL
jgi:phage gpG-like protein